MVLFIIEIEFAYIVELVEINWLKLIVEDLNNFLLKEVYKAKDITYNVWRNFTSNI